MILFHYTCSHGVAGIEHDGQIKPRVTASAPWDEPLVWLSSVTVQESNRAALGLTSLILACDRMSHLFRVVTDDAVPWSVYRKGYVSERKALALEAAPGSRPALWWVSTVPLTMFERIR